ncbi:MAG: DsrE family protein [Candidatus Bathyarchaeia archaeon]
MVEKIFEGETRMSKILIHITSGTGEPTKTALAFLVAKTAKEEGHDVTMFLAGDAVNLIKDETINSLVGIGTGSLKEHFDFITKQKIPIYLSGMSSKARGISENDLKDKNAQFALPKILVNLTVENDKVLVY